MHRRFGVVVALIGALLLVLSPAPARLGAGRARAAQMWEVRAGAPVEGVEVNAFLPRTVTVSVGDTVMWRFLGFHTVTFLGNNPPPDLFVPGPGPGELSAGPAFFPIPFPPAPGAATYDGSGVLSSGTPSEEGGAETPPFAVTFTRPGTYTYVCLVHPGQTGTVVVLPAGSSLPETPDAVTARGDAELATLRAALQQVEQGARPGSATVGSATVQTVSVGLSTAFGASLMRFVPGNVTVRRGDVIAFVNADSLAPHTVTFTSGAAPPPLFTPRGLQPNGLPLLVATADVAGPVGGTTYTGQGYLNSGLMLPGQGFVVRIDAPPGTYEYICIIHVALGMRGTITVTE
jgi:plastocyanin